MTSIIHPIITEGTHIIIDIHEIENYDMLQFTQSISDILDKIVAKFNFNNQYIMLDIEMYKDCAILKFKF